MWKAWLRAGVAIVVVTGLYFFVPLRPQEFQGLTVVRVTILAGGIVLLTWVVARQVSRTIRDNQRLGERIAMLLTIVTVVVAFFAAVYFVMQPQFSGLATRLDALYFSVLTLCTVGYGDIVPVTQWARAIVTVQMIFDLIIVTTAISLVVTVLRLPRDQEKITR